jgi:hypothetical protein
MERGVRGDHDDVLTGAEDGGRRPDFEGQPPADRKLVGSGRARRARLAAGRRRLRARRGARIPL